MEKIFLIDLVAFALAMSSSKVSLSIYNEFDPSQRDKIFSRRSKLSMFTFIPVALVQIALHLTEIMNDVHIFNLIAICLVLTAYIYRTSSVYVSWNLWRRNGEEDLLKSIVFRSKVIAGVMAIIFCFNFIEV